MAQLHTNEKPAGCGSALPERGADAATLRAMLRHAAVGVSGADGQCIFSGLVTQAAVALGVDYAFIGQLLPGVGQRVRIIAGSFDGQLDSGFEYDLRGTPCETVVGLDFHFYSDGVAKRFPDAHARELAVEGYAALPLFDSRGRPLGLMAVMHRQSLADRELIEWMLRLFSVRAAVELERLQAVRDSQMSAASYRAIFEASEDAIFIHDSDTGAIVDANPKACAAYGYSYEELLRLDVGDLSSGVPPYTLTHAAEHLARAKIGVPVRFEWHRRNRDGSLHWDEVDLKRATIDGVDRIIAFTRDITERKERDAALRASEAQLRQAQKMEAIGHLAGGIAHDFNNILTGILGYITMAQDWQVRNGDAKLCRYLGRAQLAGQRARELIQQLLTFSRGQRGEPRPLALEPLLKEVVRLLESMLPSTIELETRCDPDLPSVLVDPVHMEQVLINLCINARDAMHGSGHLLVTLRVVECRTECACASCREPMRGSHVELAVHDTGQGIKPELTDRIFEPFFTTKEVGKGSGMGLSVVHGIVHEAGGHIAVQSVPGQGATFRILLPHAPQSRAAADEASEPSDAVMGAPDRLRGRVLLVEDESTVREFMTDLLEDWGLDVTTCASGPDALTHLEAIEPPFDLVILDHTMPKMTGFELGCLVLERFPRLPVILYTGYPEALIEDQVLAAGFTALARKPLDVDAFRSLLRSWV